MFSSVNLIVAQAAAPQPAANGMSGLIQMLPLILIFGVMIFIMFRSQRKQAKERQTMLDRLKKGDQIITVGGVHATVEEVKDKTCIVKIAENVKIEINKGGIGSIEGASAR